MNMVRLDTSELDLHHGKDSNYDISTIPEHLHYPDTTIGKSRHKGGANETKAIHEDSLHLEPTRPERVDP